MAEHRFVKEFRDEIISSQTQDQPGGAKAQSEISYQLIASSLKPRYLERAKLLRDRLRPSGASDDIHPLHEILLKQFVTVVELATDFPPTTQKAFDSYIDYLTLVLARIENDEKEMAEIRKNKNLIKFEKDLTQNAESQGKTLDSIECQVDDYIKSDLSDIRTSVRNSFKMSVEEAVENVPDKMLNAALQELIKCYKQIGPNAHIELNKMVSGCNSPQDLATKLWRKFQIVNERYETLLDDGDKALLRALWTKFGGEGQNKLQDEDDTGGTEGGSETDTGPLLPGGTLTREKLIEIYTIIMNPEFPGGLQALYDKHSGEGVTKKLICDLIEHRASVLEHRNNIRQNSIDRLRKATNQMYVAMAMRDWQIEEAPKVEDHYSKHEFVIKQNNEVYYTEKEQRDQKIRDRIFAWWGAPLFSRIGAVNEAIVPAFAWVFLLAAFSIPLAVFAGLITFIGAYWCNQYTLERSIEQTLIKLFITGIYKETDSIYKKVFMTTFGLVFGLGVTSVCYYCLGAYALAGIFNSFALQGVLSIAFFMKISVLLLLVCSPVAIITGPIIGALFFVATFKYLSNFSPTKLLQRVKDFFFSPWSELDRYGRVRLVLRKLGAVFQKIGAVAFTGLIVFFTFNCFLGVIAPLVTVYVVALVITIGGMVTTTMIGLGKSDFLLSKVFFNMIFRLPLKLIVLPFAGLAMAVTWIVSKVQNSDKVKQDNPKQAALKMWTKAWEKYAAIEHKIIMAPFSMLFAVAIALPVFFVWLRPGDQAEKGKFYNWVTSVFNFINQMGKDFISDDHTYSDSHGAYEEGLLQKAEKRPGYSSDEWVTLSSVVPNSLGQGILFAFRTTIDWFQRMGNMAMTGLAVVGNFLFSAGPHWDEMGDQFGSNKIQPMKKFEWESTKDLPQETTDAGPADDGLAETDDLDADLDTDLDTSPLSPAASNSGLYPALPPSAAVFTPQASLQSDSSLSRLNSDKSQGSKLNLGLSQQDGLARSQSDSSRAKNLTQSGSFISSMSNGLGLPASKTAKFLTLSPSTSPHSWFGSLGPTDRAPSLPNHDALAHVATAK